MCEQAVRWRNVAGNLERYIDDTFGPPGMRFALRRELMRAAVRSLREAADALEGEGENRPATKINGEEMRP